MDFRPKKKLGQNFLADKRILTEEAELALLGKGETVLEIGPGDGRLTRLLSERAGRVVAIEKDESLRPLLSDLPANVEIIFGDALEAPLPEFDKVVANIPYNISSKLTFRLLEKGFSLGILSYQKEFAERMAGRPGSKDWGRLSATCAFLASVEIVRKIPAGAFVPKPKVDSCVVRIIPKEKPRGWSGIKKTIDLLFVHPGKTVGAVVRKGGKFPEIDSAGFSKRRIRSLDERDIEEISRILFPG